MIDVVRETITAYHENHTKSTIYIWKDDAVLKYLKTWYLQWAQ